jgi:hypothetical protein
MDFDWEQHAAAMRRSAAMSRAVAAYHAALSVSAAASADVWEAIAVSDPDARREAQIREDRARVEAALAWAEWERLRDGGALAGGDS